ncbi:MAG: hypothetical protein MRERV_20c053, partial [Mycoplasmataceae bacterium RV_VA103A]
MANVITGIENKFKESGTSVSGTREIQSEEVEINGIWYRIIDTVGIGDTKLKKEEVLDKIAEAVYLAKDGISQVFFVISKKFDQSEMGNFNLLKAIVFDQEVVNHTTIVRTRFEKFKDLEKCQEDIDSMVGGGNKLSEIIKSCQKRVIYVDNPSLNLVSDKNEDKAGKKEREAKIENRKETRGKSREVLLEHLEKVCHKGPYQPSKLQKLSDEISVYMEQKIKKKEELEEKEKTRKALEKLEREAKKKEK